MMIMFDFKDRLLIDNSYHVEGKILLKRTEYNTYYIIIIIYK